MSTASRGVPAVRFIGAFESAYLPLFDVDVAEGSDHSTQWRTDLDAALAAGVTRFRYPLRWHRIEAEPGQHDWREPDEQLGYLRDRGVEVIADLLHHSSHPRWLTDAFRDPRFGPAYLRFVEGVANRYPWLEGYTLVNEPFATLFLAGHQALWPPYDSGVEGFVRLARNVMPALSAAWTCLDDTLERGHHVWVDTCETHRGTAGSPAEYAALANDRRFALLDLALGRAVDPDRPFIRALLEAGGEPLLDLPPVRVDTLGLDYYCHSEWWYDHSGGHSPSPHPVGFAAVAEEYAQRYGLPMVLAETNLRGQPSDRVSWMRYMLEQYELARSRGVPLEGFCWFPSVDSCDWDSLLARPGGRPDPVGVVSVRDGQQRVRTCFTDAWESAVAGRNAALTPAYRFQAPCDRLLAGYLPALDHWPWQDPPPDAVTPAIHLPPDRSVTMPATTTAPAPDLVVLSHLRWDWVWQRPQHLVSRFARRRAADGGRTWFVEEPVFDRVEQPGLRVEPVLGGVTRVRLVLPEQLHTGRHAGFDAPGTETYGELLDDLISAEGTAEREVMLYTPMALEVAEALQPSRLLYDVMDDLSSFNDAPTGLVLRHRRALTEAAVVFTGGRSLHRSVLQHRSTDTLLFPSGVESSHYARSLALRTEAGGQPVAGYVGVIDERLDLDLVEELARRLPDWTVRMVGPVAKIDPDRLPRSDRIEYTGMAAYDDLPAIMAGFDVALMPFALNEATRSISPTKTLEYLAAGLPVVSTPVPDVVADHQHAVTLAQDAAGFARACRLLRRQSASERLERSRRIARAHEWDVIADQMLRAVESRNPAGATARWYADGAHA